jgi:hypothetical protein
MLSTKDLGLIKCHECRKPFDKAQSVYTILSRTWNAVTARFQQEFVTTDTGGMIPKELNFHQDCFINVAGKDYSP